MSFSTCVYLYHLLAKRKDGIDRFYLCPIELMKDLTVEFIVLRYLGKQLIIQNGNIKLFDANF